MSFMDFSSFRYSNYLTERHMYLGKHEFLQTDRAG
jgi:hypothetical protein